MDKEEKRKYWDFNDDVELGEDWSILDDDLMLTGGNNYLEKDEARRLVEKMRRRTKR